MHPDQVLPFYVLCDESLSMTDHIAALNESLRVLRRAINVDHAAAKRIRLCVICFSGSPRMLLPLRRPSEITEIAFLATEEGSNFGAAFRFLRQTIETDVALLKAQRHQVHRPAVFFFSDGQPTDPATWPSALATLMDPNWSARPNMIAFGVGDVDRPTIDRIGTFRAYPDPDVINPEAALHECARELTARPG